MSSHAIVKIEFRYEINNAIIEVELVNKRETIRFLKQKIRELPALAKLPYNNSEYQLWLETVRGVVANVFGPNSIEYQKISEKYPITGSYTEVRQSSYFKNLQKREITLRSIIDSWEKLGLDDEANIKNDQRRPKAFIAHEGMTQALDKVKSFLGALGIDYVIAEIESSDGRSIEKQVQWAQAQADFAVILATKGKAINKMTGTSYMALNVADELGRAREIFKNRIILLLEEGVEPHTNVSEIVYEPFVTQNMENAFIKIAKEIRHWKLL
jgi:D-alanine-D-alanine ligase-like ATP-grasp enzyme